MLLLPVTPPEHPVSLPFRRAMPGGSKGESYAVHRSFCPRISARHRK